MCQPSRFRRRGVEHEQVRRQPWSADDRDDSTVRCHRGGVDADPTVDRPAELAVGDRRGHEVDSAVVLEQGMDATPVRRKYRAVRFAIEGARQEHRLFLTYANDRDHGLKEPLGNVRALGTSRDVANPLSIGVPYGRIVGPGVRGHSDRFLFFPRCIGIDQPDIRVPVAVRLFGSIADEGDSTAVGRPGGRVVS